MTHFSYKGQSRHCQPTLESAFASIAVHDLILVPETLSAGRETGRDPEFQYTYTCSVTVLIGEDTVRTEDGKMNPC
jgi:hypothetical protein